MYFRTPIKGTGAPVSIDGIETELINTFTDKVSNTFLKIHKTLKNFLLWHQQTQKKYAEFCQRYDIKQYTCQLAQHVIPTNLLTRVSLQGMYLRTTATNSSYRLRNSKFIHKCMKHDAFQNGPRSKVL